MRSGLIVLAGIIGALAALVALHIGLLRLPYFWDEAGYYVPAAWDIYRDWSLVPTSTLPTGHTPLVMVYLALAWRAFGFSTIVTRLAMLLFAAAVVTATYALARRVAGREAAIWSAALLALSPLFFAQSTLAFLDLPAALFTTLAVLALIEGRMLWFAVSASLAVLTKETAIVILPVAWAYSWWRGRVNGARPRCQDRDAAHAVPLREMAQGGTTGDGAPLRKWIALTVPVIPLAAWTLYFHHKTGFWTGNAEYLQYNLFSTLEPGRIFWSLLRRLYEVFIGSFNWLLALGAIAWTLWGVHHRTTETQRKTRDFLVLATGIVAAYILMLSVVGGAVLPRYLLPVYPAFFVACVAMISGLPKAFARGLCGVTATCFVAAWFINPPYPFAYENNLAYADFVRLHQDAARYLESRPPGERILSAWPATDELSRPFLGYVRRPLRAVPMEGFTAKDFAGVSPDSFDLLYLHSRKWNPENDWLARIPVFRRAQERYFGYAPDVRSRVVALRFGLKLLQEFERRGQWVRIYEKENVEIEPEMTDTKSP